MAHYCSNVFSIEIDEFYEDVDFVFCNETKTEWLNPKSQSKMTKLFGNQHNFHISQSNTYTILDQQIFELTTFNMK